MTKKGKTMRIILKVVALLTFAFVMMGCPQPQAPSDESFTVTFDGRGGEVKRFNDSGELELVSSVEVKNKTKLSNLPLSLLENHAFLGWTDSSGKDFTHETVVTSDITLMAQLQEANLDESYYVQEGNTYTVIRPENSPILSGEIVISSMHNGFLITKIGGSVFSKSALTSVTIPNTITEIGRYAFSSSTLLENAEIPDSVTTIGSYAFNNTAITSVIIPDSVTKIETSTFSYCSNLKSIEIPNTVTSIGYMAFVRAGLTSITIPDSVTIISGGAFYRCSYLRDVSIGKNVKSIGLRAFKATALKNITIPDSVISIGWEAFIYCDDLTSITIPHSVTTIEYNVFEGCTADGFEITVDGKTEAQKPDWIEESSTGWHDDWDKKSDTEKHVVNWEK